MASVSELAERALRRLEVAIIPLADRPPLTVTIPAAVLATGALVELGVIASEEAPSETDQALAMAKLSAMHASLAANAGVWWTVDGVPEAVSEEYIKMTAVVLASSFGKQADPKLVSLLETRVRRIALVLSSPSIAVEAVVGVHQDLAMRGKARWTVFDIPPAVEDIYVYQAAYALAPVFGLKPSADDAKQAELMLARYIALPTSGERVMAEYF